MDPELAGDPGDILSSASIGLGCAYTSADQALSAFREFCASLGADDAEDIGGADLADTAHHLEAALRHLRDAGRGIGTIQRVMEGG